MICEAHARVVDTTRAEDGSIVIVLLLNALLVCVCSELDLYNGLLACASWSACGFGWRQGLSKRSRCGVLTRFGSTRTHILDGRRVLRGTPRAATYAGGDQLDVY